MNRIEEVHVDDNEQYCARQANEGYLIKFAVSDKGTTRQLVLSAGGRHADLVPANAELVGAGFIGRKEGRRDDDGKLISDEVYYKPYWDSDSCREEFGLDRPKDIEAQESVLKEVRAAFAGWLNKVLNV